MTIEYDSLSSGTEWKYPFVFGYFDVAATIVNYTEDKTLSLLEPLPIYHHFIFVGEPFCPPAGTGAWSGAWSGAKKRDRDP